MVSNCVFIDSRVADYPTLISNLGANTEWAPLNACGGVLAVLHQLRKYPFHTTPA